MLFTSFVFLLAFLPITYAVFWLLKTAQSRYVWLTVTGYVFYGWWNPWFCLVMAFSTLTSYLAGRGFLRWSTPRARRLCLVVPIVIDLGLLGFFKYANFAAESVASVFALFGLHGHVPHWNIILPIGISFYTFHTISYIVDCYRGVITPTRNLFEFSAYVSLFSQLVAGPIVRFRQVRKDFESLATASRTRWLSRGIGYFITGMVQKLLIADGLASFIDPALAHYGTLSTGTAWLAATGFAFQIYFDFSGYSDMAIGLGYMFGIRIPVNFNSPFKALDPADFWRRWHISLSTCLRDYIFVPLGRMNRERLALNIMITMFLGALWHGANWTFVVWGLLQGLALVAYRRWSSTWDLVPPLMRQASMMIFTIVGAVLFRSTDLGMATTLYRTMLVPTSGAAMASVQFFVPLLVVAILWSMAGPNAQELQGRWRPTPVRALALSLAFGATIALMVSGAESPFLYFQF